MLPPCDVGVEFSMCRNKANSKLENSSRISVEDSIILILKGLHIPFSLFEFI